eukprot:1107109-Amphidinium_carterae.1
MPPVSQYWMSLTTEAAMLRRVPSSRRLLSRASPQQGNGNRWMRQRSEWARVGGCMAEDPR